MDRQSYIERLVEHYEVPKYQGSLPDADAVAEGHNPGCGDIVTIYLNVGEGNIAQEIRFEAEGCTISQGAVSILLDTVQGKSLAEIQAITYNDLVDSLGRSVVLSRVHCATLGLKTLKEAIQKYYKQHLQLST